MTSQTDFLNNIVSPPRGWTGVFTLLGFGVIGNLIAGLLSIFADNSTWLLTALIASIVLLLWGIYLLRKQAAPLILVPEDQRPAKHRGLIVLVGTGRPGEDPMSQSAGIAIEYHMSAGQKDGLETCWLIATGGERGSIRVAQDLEATCKEKNITPHIRMVHDPFSVQETYNVVQKIYRQELTQVGFSEQEVISDFTGGVKPMSAGMILACGHQRPMQYMHGRKEGIASVPMLVKFTPRGR